MPDHGAAGPITPGEPVSEPTLGIPERKKTLSALDCTATALSLLCLAAAILIIHPNLPFAVKLGTNKQLTALGFLLGVINQCLQRVLPFLFVLFEARSGRPTLQNFQGLLSLSPLSKQLAHRWRFSLVLMQATPLVLGVLYKQFSDGVTTTQPESTPYGIFAPAAPPGFQSWIGRSKKWVEYGAVAPKWNAILANFTVPFLDATNDDTSPAPPDNTVYGFNTVLLSNTSVASLDAPTPSRILTLQRSLDSGSSIHLTGRVRGTVARFNETLGDEAYWNQTYPTWLVKGTRISNGFGRFLLHAGVAADDSPIAWNGSWVLIGSMSIGEPVSNLDWEVTGREFLGRAAMRFDVKRHRCTGTWKVTRSSIELVSGGCGAEPLDDVYQYYTSCQLELAERLGNSVAEYLTPFATFRNASSWLVPTNAAVVAAAFQAIVAGSEGFVPIQPGGEIWLGQNVTGYLNETYYETETTSIDVPTLRADWKLYVILALQPAATVLVLFFAGFGLYHTPVSRDFGLVTLVAGVDGKSVGLIRGAGFSGKVQRPVGVGIMVSPPDGGVSGSVASVSYVIGGGVAKGSVKHGQIYS